MTYRMEPSLPPLFIIGSMRSGKTLLKRLMQRVYPQIVSLTDDDCESRTFWQFYGLRIGARATGTYCYPAYSSQVTDGVREAIQTHVQRRSTNRHLLVNDNAHLMNKIGFVAQCLPNSRFVHVVRDVMALVAYAKQGFQRGNTSNESYSAFIHYWPDGELACWYTLKNNLRWHWPTRGTCRRITRELCQMVHLKGRPEYRSPSVRYRHIGLRAFLKDHPDLTRYYPGAGFARLPEAWISQNHGVLMQFDHLASERVARVTYTELVMRPRDTVKRILEFVGVQNCDCSTLPQTLSCTELAAWQELLDRDEQDVIKGVIQKYRKEYARLCDVFRHQFISENVISNTHC